MKKATPLLTVDAIEPCLPFWTSLGFEVTVTVPHEDAMGFAMLHNGEVELMYQTRASVEADLEASGPRPDSDQSSLRRPVALFVEVDDLDVAIAATDGAEVLVPRRKTFYGMDELFVRAPCGTVVGLAAKVEGAE